MNERHIRQTYIFLFIDLITNNCCQCTSNNESACLYIAKSESILQRWNDKDIKTEQLQTRKLDLPITSQFI